MKYTFGSSRLTAMGLLLRRLLAALIAILFFKTIPVQATMQDSNLDATPLKTEGKPYRSFQLPGESWGLAYEPVSGRIAVTNDQAGILIYDVDDLLEGKHSPQVVAVKGIPSGVCFKNFQSQPKFVVSKIDDPNLDVIDSKSLMRATSVRLSGPSGIAKISGSSSEKDPHLYCIAASSIDQAPGPDWGGRLLRVDIANNQIRMPTERFVSIVPTEDSATLLGTTKSLEEPCFLRFENSADSLWLNTNFLYGRFRTDDLKNDIGLATNLGVFRRNPFTTSLAGMNENGFFVTSRTTSFKSKFIQMDSFPPPKKKGDLAGRTPLKYSSTVGTGTCESWATDDERRLFLLVKNDVLLVCRLNDLDLASPPPNLVPVDRMARVASIGEKIQFRFNGLPDGTHVEFLAETSSPHVNTHSTRIQERFYTNKDGGGLNWGTPFIVNNELRWIPTPNQAGWNTLRFRASLGKHFAEWDWGVFIQTPSFSLPFIVKGMEISSEFEAVAWGEAFRESGKEEPDHIVAKVDLKTKTIVRKLVIPEAVRCAAVLGDDVYVCSGASPRLFDYDLQTRKIVQSVDSLPLDTLHVIGGKYLLAEVVQGPKESQRTIRYELPNLDEASVRTGLNTDLAGRMCGSDILWDGVLWDENWKPKLLLHPLTRAGDNQPAYPHRDNGVRLLSGGPMLFEVNLSNSYVPKVRKQFLQHYPADVSYQKGNLHTNDFARSTRNQTVMDWCIGAPFNSYEGCQITSSKTHVYATTRGRVFELPTEYLIPNNSPPFAIEQKQNHFLLNATEEISLDYDAAGATNFRLALHAPVEGFEFWASESSSGHFAIKLEVEKLRTFATQVAGSSSVQPDLDVIKKYVLNINPFFQSLEKAKPRGIAVPIRAVVIAEHFDGEQKAGMQHYFYVDVPGKWIITSPENSSTIK